MTIDTHFFKRCILTLKQAHVLLQESEVDSIQYEIYRAACVKEYELILGVHDLINIEAVERWIEYRDNPFSVEEVKAHDYGVKFAETTLILIPKFIEDASSLEQAMQQY